MATVNVVEVAPDEADNDDEITDAVRLALESGRLVDEGQIAYPPAIAW